MRHTLKDEVYGRICEALMSGEFAPGERLTVRRMAELTQTSPMPVREAFRRLGSEGALEATSSGAMRVPTVDSERLKEIVMLRVMLEGLAARLAARSITRAEIAQIEVANQQVLEAIARRDTHDEARANERFHFGIYQAARSPELLRLIQILWLRMGPVLVLLLNDYNQGPEQTKRRNTATHGRLISALRAGDGEAAERFLRQDLEDAATFYLARLRKREAATLREASSS